MSIGNKHCTNFIIISSRHQLLFTSHIRTHMHAYNTKQLCETLLQSSIASERTRFMTYRVRACLRFP